MTLINLEGYQSRDIESDICIIGGGIAGLTIAESFKNSGLKVCLFEAGSRKFDINNKYLFDAKNIGRPHKGLKKGRFRVLGGTSSRWGGQALPFKKEIFLDRNHINIKKWPISSKDLLPYVKKAEAILKINDNSYEKDFLNKIKGPNFKIENQNIDMRFSKWSPFKSRNFANNIGKECYKSPNISIFINATVSYINLFEDGKSVKNIEVKNNKYQKYICRSKIYIIAAGAIETVRILLLSKNVHKNGISNYNNLLGKKFHDHLSIKAAEIIPKNKDNFLKAIAPWYINGTKHSLKMESSSKWEKKNKCLNIMAHITFESNKNYLILILRKLIFYFQSGDKLTFPERNLKSNYLMRDLFDVIKIILMRFIKKRQWSFKSSKLFLNFDSEQFPSKKSEIILSDEIDEFGMQKIMMKWSWGLKEQKTFIEFKKLMKKIFKNYPSVKLKWLENFDDITDWEDRIEDTYHHMGGTNMSISSKSGIVDKDLLVNGVNNLYIASPSVFPAGASSNPTFTLITLSLRLAETIKRNFKKN